MGSNRLSKSAQVDLDRITAKAWSRFRSELADRIADLGPEEVVRVVVESVFVVAAVEDPKSGCAPYLQFVRGEGGSVLGEACGNRSLHAAHRLNKQARQRMQEIGWSWPRPKHGVRNSRVEVDQSHADQLAVMAVTALSEVFGVPHPAFLMGDVRIGEDPDLPHADTVEPRREPFQRANDPSAG